MDVKPYVYMDVWLVVSELKGCINGCIERYEDSVLHGCII